MIAGTKSAESAITNETSVLGMFVIMHYAMVA